MTDASTQAVAANIWRAMTESERHGVRFGLFPHAKLAEAEKAGYDGAQLCVELMAVASRNGGMRA